MKNLLKYFPLLLILSIFIIGCGDDEKEPCVTDPAVTVEDNIIGLWTINGESAETVTFNNDGTGSSSEASFHFSTTNDNKDYHNFDWEMEDDMTVVVTYDYSPDTPVVPFLISVDYTVQLNNCDKIEMESGFGSLLVLTK